VAIVVFGVGQLVLPPLAEHIVRQRLGDHGRVESVTVSAFPAIELLFGDADSVSVKMSSFTASQTQVGTNLNQASGVSTLRVSIAEVNSGLVKVNDVSLTKHGSQLTGTGEITEANLRASVPLLQSVTPIASAHGQVTLQGTAKVPFVGQVSAEANLGARDGKVVVSGTGLIGSFLHLTVWSNPDVSVESISGRPTSAGITLSARGRLK
jgi:hypothetical protein